MLNGVNASAVACPAGPWRLLLDFLAERLALVTREDWEGRMTRGEVLDEAGSALGPTTAYAAGRRVFYYRLLAHEAPIPFEARVLYRDELLLVADKPHFLPVTPKGRYVQQTLLVRLQRELGLSTLSPIHRLDRETAGLTLFCMQPQHRDAYQRLFRERAVEKVYEAIAPAPELGRRQDLTLPLDYRCRLVEREEAFMQMQEVAGEPNAQTRISLIERLSGGLAHYELRPRSGIKHQLRAQMAALGLPIVGDRIYPVLQAEELEPDYKRPLQLLARSIAFDDPVTGQPRRFDSEMRLLLSRQASTAV
ncbi:pseudouridine synthase [Pelomonas sp. V22]|nr:pseudouridine synthase [Pelomonas sp. V22]